MKTEKAKQYLKLLHDLERKYSNDLFTTDLKELSVRLRKEFLNAYQGKEVASCN